MAIVKFQYQSTEGYSDNAGSSDQSTLGKLTFAGVSGVAIDAGGQLISNVGAPASATDAATKGYVDTLTSGISIKTPVRAATTGNIALGTAPNTVDGVTLVVNDRVLVKNQTTASQNGIYFVQTLGTGANGFWVRATDADSSAEVKGGMSVFVNEGTVAADTTWVLTTNDPITLDTTSLTFTQFNGLGQIVAGAGLTKTGNTLDIGEGDGILVGADDISIDLDTNSGLALNGTSPGKKLAFLPDTTRGLNKDASGAYVRIPASNPGLAFSSGDLDVKVDANGGILKDASGVGVKIVDTNRLTKGSTGLDVAGVPSQFKVAGTAVSTNVTAANLNTLTAGSGSNADALHTHASSAATESPTVMSTLTNSATVALSKGEAVYFSAADVITRASAAAAGTSRVIGLATANIAVSASGKIIHQGLLTGAGTGFTAGEPYFLSNTTGQPVPISSILSGQRTVQVGIAKNATDLFVQIIDRGVKS